MARPAIRVATLQQSIPIVDGQGRPTVAFVTLINNNTGNVVATLNAISSIPEIQQALQGINDATQAAQEAAADAALAAGQAQQQTDATKREAALQGSYIDPASVLTASPTTITIAAHTRRYADGTSVAVNGGSVAATAQGDTDYVSYSDPQRAGGAVTYVVSTTAPTQTGDTHVVGAVTIPTTGTQQGGDGPRQPGYVTPRQPLP
jgi:hypothetical protein